MNEQESPIGPEDMPREPTPGKQSKPRGLAAVIWLVIVACTIGIVAMNLVPAGDQSSDYKLAERPESVPFHFGRLFVRLSSEMNNQGQPAAAQSFVDLVYPPKLQDLEDERHPLDVIRRSAVLYELGLSEQAIDELASAREQLGPLVSQNNLSTESARAYSIDLDALEDFYQGETIDESARTRLIDRHGWWAQLALSRDAAPEADPWRAEFEQNARSAVVGASLAFLVVLAFLVACLVGIVIGIVMLRGGDLRWKYARLIPRDVQPTVVYLQTTALFFVAFLGYQLLATFVYSNAPPAWLGFALWGMLPIMFFPAFSRRQSLQQTARSLGLIAPKGVFRELVAGVIGYFALSPVLLIAILSVFVLMSADSLFREFASSAESVVIAPPMVDPLPIGGPGFYALALLAVTWAPLVEELVFRGNLYRHMRGATNAVITIGVTSFLFGIIHPRAWYAIPALMIIGGMLAVLREWRGSIIAPITAHAVHNATIMLLLYLLLSL